MCCFRVSLQLPLSHTHHISILIVDTGMCMCVRENVWNEWCVRDFIAFRHFRGRRLGPKVNWRLLPIILLLHVWTRAAATSAPYCDKCTVGSIKVFDVYVCLSVCPSVCLTVGLSFCPPRVQFVTACVCACICSSIHAHINKCI